MRRTDLAMAGVTAAALGLLCAPGVAQSPAGTAFTYQGELREAGLPVSGPTDMMFSLWTAPGVGGVQVGSTLVFAPAAPNPPVNVASGLFTVVLDFGPGAFNGEARWLEIAVRHPSGGGAYTTLAPRQELTPAPYALYALAAPPAANADTVDGFHASGTPAASTLLALSAGGKFPVSVLTMGAGSGLDADLLDGQHGSYFQNAGNLNAGTLSDARLSSNVALLAPDQTFTGKKTFSQAASFTAATAPFTVSSSGLVSNLNSDLLDGQHGSYFQNAGNLNAGTLSDARLSSNVALLNTVQTFTANKHFSGNVGIGTTTPGARLDVRSGDLWLHSGQGVLRLGYPTGDAWHLSTGDGGATLLFVEEYGAVESTRVAFKYGGNVGVGTVSPAARLDVTSSQGAESTIRAVHTAASNDTPAIYGEHAVTDYYGIGVRGVGGYRGVEGRVTATGANWYSGVYGYVSGGTGTNVAVYGSASGGTNAYGGYFDGKGYFSGTVGIGTTSPGGKLGVYATGPYAIHAQSTDTYSTALFAMGGTSGNAADFRGNVRIFDRATNALVVELGTGLDYAEGFDVTPATPPQPGAVLVIDADHPGRLRLSATAYDTKVAGIVAGARGLGSGVRLGTEQFDCNVALAGRVYCNVDATWGAVQPGDLLTTSPTPGYAMKAADPARTPGAVLGKAMEPLAAGQKGQILVLVTLQ